MSIFFFKIEIGALVDDRNSGVHMLDRLLTAGSERVQATVGLKNCFYVSIS
jgi:hypothetical protein